MSKLTPAGWLKEILNPGAAQRERDRMQALLDAAPVDATPRRISAPASARSECGQRGWHKISCSQRTDRAPQMPATREAGGVVTVCQRSCRCGPDGCADSVACPKGER